MTHQAHEADQQDNQQWTEAETVRTRVLSIDGLRQKFGQPPAPEKPAPRPAPSYERPRIVWRREEELLAG